MRGAEAAPRRGGHVPSKDELIAEAADTASLRSLDALTVYAKIVQIFTDERFDRDIANVRQCVSVFAAQDDKTVAIQTVRRLCELLPRAKLQEYPQGGHYMLFLRPDVRDSIRRLVDVEVEPQRAVAP
jgi:hypothetical protein